MKQDMKDNGKTRDKLKEEETESDLNPYQIAILNKRHKDDAKTEQMINWSIFSDKIKYVNPSSSMNPSLTIRPLDDRKHIDGIMV